MSAEGWVVTVPIVLATGNVQQLYPAWCTPGVAKAGSTNGQLLRRPRSGALWSYQVEPDGINGGTLQLYDVDGGDIGADVSSLTAITDAQLTTLIAAGKAKLIYEQQFNATGSPPTGNSPGASATGFMRGLAARITASAAGGSAKLNLQISGGYEKVESRGGY